MTRKEQIAKAFEAIFENTKRIHGKSEAIDWQKMAIHKCASYVAALPLDVPGDEEIRGEAMAYSVYPAKPDGYPDFDVERAVIFDEAAIWMRSEILKRNTP